jgi:hypothetical protein
LGVVHDTQRFSYPATLRELRLNILVRRQSRFATQQFFVVNRFVFNVDINWLFQFAKLLNLIELRLEGDLPLAFLQKHPKIGLLKELALFLQSQFHLDLKVVRVKHKLLSTKVELLVLQTNRVQFSGGKGQLRHDIVELYLDLLVVLANLLVKTFHNASDILHLLSDLHPQVIDRQLWLLLLHNFSNLLLFIKQSLQLLLAHDLVDTPLELLHERLEGLRLITQKRLEHFQFRKQPLY